MVFNSLTFILFFALVLGLHHLPFSWRVKKFNLLLASCLFYAAWNPPFVALLLGAAVVDFWLARWIDRVESPTLRTMGLALSLGLNLGLLCFFKYANFMLANFVQFLAWFGISFQAAAPDVVLPLGISFYTFETISYLIDVYRRRIKAWDSFLDYALFLTFFPHLVAGPIVRAADFLPQCQQPRRASGEQLGWGLALMAIGLFEKVLLADVFFAPVADRVFAAKTTIGGGDAWIGALAFSGQIFFDFAGYSTCGIGAALCLGFVLKNNFHFPYAAIGFSDFWRRWHISLSSWLRDYLYIPLGGNRVSPLRCNANLLITMLLGGLWHGASWTFVAWGGLHGCYLMGERFLRPRLEHFQVLQSRACAVLAMALTYVLVLVSWVFFRAPDFHSAYAILGEMFRLSGRPLAVLSAGEATVVLAGVAIMVFGQWVMRDSSIERLVERMPWWARSVSLALIVAVIVLTPGEDRAFIYFQF